MAAIVRGACERTFSQLTTTQFREEVILRDLSAITRWYPGARTLLQVRLLTLIDSLPVTPGVPAASAPAMQELLRAVAALLKANILDGEDIDDCLVAALTCRMSNILKSVNFQDAATYFG